MTARAAFLAALLLAPPAFADAPAESLRPLIRSGGDAPTASVATPDALPLPRPGASGEDPSGSDLDVGEGALMPNDLADGEDRAPVPGTPRALPPDPELPRDLVLVPDPVPAEAATEGEAGIVALEEVADPSAPDPATRANDEAEQAEGGAPTGETEAPPLLSDAEAPAAGDAPEAVIAEGEGDPTPEPANDDPSLSGPLAEDEGVAETDPAEGIATVEAPDPAIPDEDAEQAGTAVASPPELDPAPDSAVPAEVVASEPAGDAIPPANTLATEPDVPAATAEAAPVEETDAVTAGAENVPLAEEAPTAPVADTADLAPTAEEPEPAASEESPAVADAPVSDAEPAAETTDLTPTAEEPEPAALDESPALADAPASGVTPATESADAALAPEEAEPAAPDESRAMADAPASGATPNVEATETAPDVPEPLPSLAVAPGDDDPRPTTRPGDDPAAPVAAAAAGDAPSDAPGAEPEETAGIAAAPRPGPRPWDEPPERVELDGPVGTHEITVRGGLFGNAERVIEVPAFADDGATAVLLSPRPGPRPEGLEARVRAAATRTTPARVTQPGTRGQLCGRPGIVGERLDPIPGRISGCGIAEPVRVREIDGVTLTSPATVNCDAARALQDWLNEAAIPIVGRTGGGVSNLRVVASYACRTRNNQPGARLSEHSTGSAIDIAGIGLVNGQELTVLGGWRDGGQGPILQRLHAAACGTFGTVLGPESDRYHQDHFHFDVAAYRSGSYCR
ncbi:hypothetical protein HKCCE2091_07750 [Rhodobacterales bacterium HKCCE2091]|nr:hypothetical protein [Rhodobacterales bacterium HKCCE2091]